MRRTDLVVLALAVVALALVSGGGEPLLLEREMHYVIIAALVAFYVYAQRVAR